MALGIITKTRGVVWLQPRNMVATKSRAVVHAPGTALIAMKLWVTRLVDCPLKLPKRFNEPEFSPRVAEAPHGHKFPPFIPCCREYLTQKSRRENSRMWSNPYPRTKYRLSWKCVHPFARPLGRSRTIRGVLQMQNHPKLANANWTVLYRFIFWCRIF